MRTNVGWAVVFKNGWLASDPENIYSQSRNGYPHSGVSRFDFFTKRSDRSDKASD